MDEIEQKASSMGWTPQDRFKGDQTKWVDAETFVKRGEEIMPILKKTNEGLRNEMMALRGEFQTTKQMLDEAKGALTEFQKYHEEDSKRQYERAYEKLKSDKVEALRDSDHAAVVEIDEAIRLLDKQSEKKPEVKQPSQVAPDPTQDPIFKKWQADNKDWYGEDEEKTAYATATAHYLKVMNPSMAGRDFLDKVTEEVNLRFGEPKGRVDRVEGSRNGSGANGSGRSFADLPPDAKASCDKFGARLVGEGKAYKTQAEWRKQYVKDFFGGE